MRISDWSSDVCSSDLSRDAFVRVAAAEQEYTLVGAVESALESAVLPGRIGSAVRRGAARQDGVRHGFGRRIAQTIFDPDHVALIEKSGQLTVPVDVKMTGSNEARDDCDPTIAGVRPE